MKKVLLLSLLLPLLVISQSHAQTKVFKEVSEDISQQMKAIVQDNALVGYLFFTQLEKASQDSFNYKISITDENMNDIGTVNFREEKLILQAVSFEQDVLCLAYVKSNIIGHEFKGPREYNRSLPNAKNSLMLQFLGLNGKIIKTNSIKTDIKMSNTLHYITSSKMVGDGELKHPMQLKNISQKGFALFYGDEKKNNLLIFNAAGKMTWQKTVAEDAVSYNLLTSSEDVYLLTKKKESMNEGGFELLGYNTKDSSTFPKYILRDKQGNSLRAIDFENDPVTGKPFISGNIINPSQSNPPINANQFSRPSYLGVFVIDIKGHKKGDIHEAYSYWENDAQAGINRRGRMEAGKTFAILDHSFRDYQGNTYFTGSSFIKRPKWVAIGFSAITLPLILPPIGILGVFGTRKAKLTDVTVFKLDPKGALSIENSIAANHTSFYKASVPFALYDTRSFYDVSNSDSKNNYLLIDDDKEIIIYNVTQKKVARTILHKEGKLQISVFPAKEGHVTVAEYNKKEKTIRYSIEAL